MAVNHECSISHLAETLIQSDRKRGIIQVIVWRGVTRAMRPEPGHASVWGMTVVT